MGIRTLTEHIKLAQDPTKTHKYRIQNRAKDILDRSDPQDQLAFKELSPGARKLVMEDQSLAHNAGDSEGAIKAQQFQDLTLRNKQRRGMSGSSGEPGVIRRTLRNVGDTVAKPIDSVSGGRLNRAYQALTGEHDPGAASEAMGAATLAGAGGGAAGLGAMKIRSAQKARAAAAAKARAAAPAAGGGAGLGKLLQKLVTKRASVMDKVAHLNALDEAATERAIEMMKIAQDMEAQGEELTFDDVMELTNPDGSNFLEGLVTDLAMAKLDENGFTE